MPDYEELSAGFKDALRNRMPDASPFGSLPEMELVDVKKGRARRRLPFAKKLTHANGVARGLGCGSGLIGMIEKDEFIIRG
jgi:hypothetical protein